MPPITHGARRIATRLATITAMGTAMGITAVGCEAPRDTSQGALEAPVTIEAREEDAGTDAAVIEVVTEDVNEDEATPSEAAPAARHGAFFDELDAPRLEVLRHAAITRIERGAGGRSVGFRVTFEDGSRGYFKPDQRFSGASDRAEVASYHVDRLLELGRVPTTTMREIPLSRLAPLLASDRRASEVIVQPDGTVRGSLSSWVEDPLVPLELGVGFEAWFRVEPAPYLTPFQRARVFIAQAAGTEPIVPPVGEEGRALPLAGEPDRDDRGAELSDLILFDHLVHNIDRWGGGFTNVRTRGRGGPLVFLDQGGAFGPGVQRIGFMDRRLAAVQCFRRSTVEAIRALDLEALRERLLDEGVGELLDARRLAGLEDRRRAILAHVDQRLALQGESATFPW